MKCWPTLSIILLVGGLQLSLQPALVFSATNLTTLRQVQVIFRHGARTIDKTYPLDPYKDESFWPPGFSQLTNLGKLQGYNLGAYLRSRYAGFISDTYSVKDVYVESSDIARTIQTSYSVMAGFFLPDEIIIDPEKYGNGTTINDIARNSSVEIPLPWKSIPVHTTPVEYDKFLRQKPDICPRYDQLLKEFTQDSDTAKRIGEENKDLFEYFSNNTGLNITSPIQSDDFYDALVIENYYNMTLPNWTKPFFGKEEVTEIALFYFQYITYTFEMKRLRVGPLLQRLVGRMNETLKQTEDEPQKKMYFYGGHDFCISGVLDTLGMYDKMRPPFASALILEIHENPAEGKEHSDKFFVEIHYRNETDVDAYKLEIPNCGDPCPLTEFAKLVNPYIPTDWNRECQQLNEPGGLSGGWIVFTILVFWVVLFFIFQLWIRSNCCKRKRKQETYSQMT